jgi:hypothetical protein
MSLWPEKAKEDTGRKLFFYRRVFSWSKGLICSKIRNDWLGSLPVNEIFIHEWCPKQKLNNHGGTESMEKHRE